MEPYTIWSDIFRHHLLPTLLDCNYPNKNKIKNKTGKKQTYIYIYIYIKFKIKLSSYIYAIFLGFQMCYIVLKKTSTDHWPYTTHNIKTMKDFLIILVCGFLSFFRTVIWFQVFQSNTNSLLTIMFSSLSSNYIAYN